MDLNSLLQGQLPDGLLDQLSQQIGGDKEQTANAASGIISTLLGGLAKNASSQDGAESLAGALDRDHDGSVLNDLAGLLGGSNQSGATNGLGILQHILGDKAGGAASMIGQMSGLSSGQSSNLMQMLAPILMGALGQAKQQNGLDGGGVASLLSNLVTQQSSNSASSPLMGLVNQFLDKDNDGSIMDDVAGMVMNNLFKR
jgi:hypothetical protein